ncbi:MAG: PSD1 and planctomycete cytochrome C domain-containing protein, partial [Limisphaerales bacterium]
MNTDRKKSNLGTWEFKNKISGITSISLAPFFIFISKIRVHQCSSVALILFLFSFSLRAAEPSPTDLAFFENKIRPIFADKCYKCHSHDAPKLKGGLSLEFRETILKGGETGPALVPGNPESSLLIKAIRYGDPDLQMPPKGEKLSDAQIEDLVQWIKMGAPDPRTAKDAAYAKDWNKSNRDHWAFQSIKKSPVPEITNTWAATPIDKFILARLEENGMKPSPLADKRTLLRRATFDLTGLPPTLAEMKDFLNDFSPDAFAKVVDRLLASPRYGERWGRFWLDTARYSDTKGDVKKNREDPRYPDAWTYRDYVIRSFNEDKPFNRFIVEQLAADKINLGTNKNALTALAFLTVGERFNGNNNDIINDRIDVVTKGTMGLTVTCARCHDHKFDPIPTKDYYSLHGVFASTREPNIGALLTRPEMTPEYVDYAKKYNAMEQQLTALKKNRKKSNRKEVQKAENDLRKEMADLEINHPGAPPRAMILTDVTKPRDSRVFLRGEAENPGEIVPRRFLEILSGSNRTPFKHGSGRLDLALAIVDPKNPLTARVIVNRIWQHHFGEGFVTTPDDFGNQSAPPSHPELIDYLASRFMEEGWSLKKMHRLIMLSSVYQQSSDNNPRYAQKDPNNRLLWRANI